MWGFVGGGREFLCLVLVICGMADFLYAKGKV